VGFEAVQHSPTLTATGVHETLRDTRAALLERLVALGASDRLNRDWQWGI
jgi:hypothetical protein